MKTQSAISRRKARLAALAKPPHKHQKNHTVLADSDDVALSDVIIRPPDQLPDPFLYNSESLLRDLDRCRELVNQISIRGGQHTHFDINTAVSAIWNLTEQIRYLLHLHREGQRTWQSRHKPRKVSHGAIAKRSEPARMVKRVSLEVG